MKRYLSCALLALVAAALFGLAAGRARAEAPPAPLPKGPGGDAPSVAAPPAPGAPAAPVVVAPPVAAAVPAACCAAPCCEAPAIKKVCVPETATREKITRVYGESCEDFCLPKCSLFGGFSLHGHKHDDCGGCADGACGGCADGGCAEGSCKSCEHCVRTRKYLVVRLHKEEECYTKCHPECQLEEPKCKESVFHHKAACDSGACLPDGGCAGVVTAPAAPPAVMPPAEKLPLPKGGK